MSLITVHGDQLRAASAGESYLETVSTVITKIDQDVYIRTLQGSIRQGAEELGLEQHWTL